MSIKTVIEDTAALARRNAVVGGTKTNSIQTTGGTIVGEPLKMDTFQNHNLPTLWSLKAARGQRYRHFRNDGDKHIEYPGLYVYLGYNYATALESVQIKNNWIADGTHPSWLVYADFLDHTDEGNDRIYTYKVNAQGEVDFNTPFEVGTGRTKQTVLDAFMGADYKTVDGWYELPCPAYYARPLYAVCFSGPSFVPCLAFISVNHTITKFMTNSPEGMDSVASYKFYPDFSKFHQWAQNWDDSYHGLIGSPRMVVDENPYCTNPDAWSDTEHAGDWRWGIFATGTTMEFIDTVDTYNFGFRPLLDSVAHRGEGFEQWNYSFVLEFQPPVNWAVPDEVGPTTDTIYQNGGDSMKPEFVKTISAQEGTLYKVRVLRNNGFENTLYLLDPSDEEYKALEVDRTANIVFREDKCDLVTQKGEEIALIVESDYEGGHLDNIVPDQKLALVLIPIRLANTQTNIDQGVGGVLAYYPRILQGNTVAVAEGVGMSRILNERIVACEILAGTTMVPDTLVWYYYRQSGQETDGPYPCGVGENEWRRFGNLCPKYKSIPLEGITNNTPGDSLGGVQPEQLEVVFGSESAPGRYYGQNGSIDLWTACDVQGGALKSYYSLYEFAYAPFSDVTKYYQHAPSGGGDPTPLEPGESIDGKDVEPKTRFGLIARVKNTKDQGEVPAPSGTTQTAGYHLEYIDFQSLRKGHWITGGDDITNYGKSLAFDDGTSRITITIVS